MTALSSLISNAADQRRNRPNRPILHWYRRWQVGYNQNRSHSSLKFAVLESGNSPPKKDEEMRTYAFTDVHGRYDLLMQALDWIDGDCGDEAAHIFGLGDYVDRGPDSARVVEFLSEGPANTKHKWTLLRGNHDQLMVRSSAGDISALEIWMGNGGFATLKSYGLETSEYRELPKPHLDFLHQLPLWAEDEHRYYVHAGFRPGIAVADQTENDLLWIREDFLHSNHDFGKPVIHGHSANVAGPEVTCLRINLDTGACYDGGRLTVAAWGNDPAEFRFESFSSANRQA